MTKDEAAGMMRTYLMAGATLEILMPLPGVKNNDEGPLIAVMVNGEMTGAFFAKHWRFKKLKRGQ